MIMARDVAGSLREMEGNASAIDDLFDPVDGFKKGGLT
jgi:hypothetical protein